MNDLAVVGAGAWGTALALQAARAGRRVVLWARRPQRLAGGTSPYLPGFPLPAAVTVTGELPAAPLLLLALPTQHLRRVAAALPPGGAVVVCAKGVELGSGLLPLEVLAEVQPHRPAGVLSGPNFAAEIAAGLPAASVIASTSAALRREVDAALSTPGFRLYGNDDPIGAQVGGAAKNVVALAAGAVIGARLGENARAALATRGLAELTRLALALGGRAETVAGLSGLGDLMLSCAGPTSRNFRLGLALGRGESLAAVLARQEFVTEAVDSAPALLVRAGAVGCELPICAAVSGLLAGRLDVATAMAALLARPRRDE
jgi:glycerol-3-phosphate dehydrogenase (NAD(P)+)